MELAVASQLLADVVATDPWEQESWALGIVAFEVNEVEVAFAVPVSEQNLINWHIFRSNDRN
jgi:hypothetical protein